MNDRDRHRRAQYVEWMRERYSAILADAYAENGILLTDARLDEILDDLAELGFPE